MLDPQELARLSQSNPEEPCCICLDTLHYQHGPVQLTRLPCGHVHHRDCAERWLSSNNSCPTCRRPVTHHTAVSEAAPPGAVVQSDEGPSRWPLAYPQ